MYGQVSKEKIVLKSTVIICVSIKRKKKKETSIGSCNLMEELETIILDKSAEFIQDLTTAQYNTH